jgi:hypothetical protein
VNKTIEAMRLALSQLKPPFDYQKDFIRFVNACIANKLSYDKKLFTSTAEAQRQHEAWFIADPERWLKRFPEAYDQADKYFLEKGLKPLGPPRAVVIAEKPFLAATSAPRQEAEAKLDESKAHELFFAKPVVAKFGNFNSPLTPTTRIAVTRHARKLSKTAKESEAAASSFRFECLGASKALKIENENLDGLNQKLSRVQAELAVTLDSRIFRKLHGSNGPTIAALRSALSDVLILRDLKIGDHLALAIAKSVDLGDHSPGQRMAIFQAMEERGVATFGVLVQKVRNEILLQQLTRLAGERSSWHYCHEVLVDCKCKPSVFVESTFARLDIELNSVRRGLGKLKSSSSSIQDFAYTVSDLTKLSSKNATDTLHRVISDLFTASFSAPENVVAIGLARADAESKTLQATLRSLEFEAKELRTELEKREIGVQKLLKVIAVSEASMLKAENLKFESLKELSELLSFIVSTSHEGLTLDIYRRFKKRNDLLLQSALMFDCNAEVLLQEDVEELLGAVDAALICEAMRTLQKVECKTCQGELPGCDCLPSDLKVFVLAESHFGLTRNQLIARLGQYGEWVWGLSHLSEAARLSRLVELSHLDGKLLLSTLLRVYFAPLIKGHFEGRAQPNNLPSKVIFQTLDRDVFIYGAMEDRVEVLLSRAADQDDPRAYFTERLPEENRDYQNKKSKALFDSLPQTIPEYND